MAQILNKNDAKDIKAKIEAGMEINQRIENGETGLERFEGFEVPYIRLSDDGKIQLSENIVTIIDNTKNNGFGSFYEYIRNFKEVANYLSESFPKFVSNNFRANLAILIDPEKKTKTMQKMSNMTLEYNTDAIVQSFINTYDASKLGISAEERINPLVHRASSELFEAYRKAKQGYVIPNITSKGLLAERVKGDQAGIYIPTLAVPAEEVSVDDVKEYFSEPFNGVIEEDIIEELCELSKEAYEHIMDNDKASYIKELSDLCLRLYALNLVEPEKKAPIEAPVEEPTGEPTEEPTEEPTDEPDDITPKFKISYQPIPKNGIRKFGSSEYKYTYGIRRIVIEDIEEPERGL